jgi:AAA ATPase domain
MRIGLVFVAGEAGVGKTRLAVEFMKAAKARGASTLYARAASGSSLQPYSVWVECVRQFASEATVLSFLEICGDVSEPMLRLLPEMTMQASPHTSLDAGRRLQVPDKS